MSILVTGGNGVLATALREFLPDAIYLGRAECDVTKREQVSRALYEHRPKIVLHAAAVTDHQTPDIETLVRTNVVGTLNVAEEAYLERVVYLSTHYVYPGETGNYRETDPVRPIGTYALTKYAGEEIVRRHHPDALIIRGSWYTPEKVRRWQEQGAFVDAYTNREPVRDAAEKIARLIERDAHGVVNIGGARRTFNAIAANFEAGSTARFRATALALPYEFPADSSVNTERYERIVGA